MAKKSEIIKPVNDYVLIRQLPPPSTKGVILLPDHAKDKTKNNRGLVLGVGPGMVGTDGKRVPIDQCKEGDVIVYSQYSNVVAHQGTITPDEGELWLITARSVMAVVENPDYAPEVLAKAAGK